MSSNKNDLFGSLFDLNGDGKTTIDEEYMAFQIMNQCNKKGNTNDDSTSFRHYASKRTCKGETMHSVTTKIAIPETLSKENYPRRKNAQKTGIVSAIIAALALSLIPLLLIWATISTYDENNSANWLVLLLFGGGGVVVLGIIWHSAISSISNCCRDLKILNDNYRKLLSKEEETESPKH